MSLTEDIALLVARANALITVYENKSQVIDTAVAAAIAGNASNYRVAYVDPIGGNDAGNGLTAATAFLTLEKAIQVTTNAEGVTFILLGDVTLRSRVQTSAQVIFFQGVDRANPTLPLQRTITIAPVAANSPDSQGRTGTAGIEMIVGRIVRSEDIVWMLPNVASAVFNKAVISFYTSGDITMFRGGIDSPSSATAAVFMYAWSASPLCLWLLETTLGANALGHIMVGVAAGSNPNTRLNYRSNVTSL